MEPKENQENTPEMIKKFKKIRDLFFSHFIVPYWVIDQFSKK